jgi:hypothetical protein
LFTVVAVILALIVLVRLVADPLATHLARRGLQDLDGFRGTLDRVHLRFLPPSAEVTRLKLIEHPGGDWDHPLLYVERTVLTPDWRKLLRLRLSLRARMEQPKIVMPEQQERKARALDDVLQELMPARLDRVEVIEGELLFASGKGKDAAELWIHDLDLVAQNIATREALQEGQPTMVTAHARVQRSGVATLFVTMDPWAQGLTFSGEAALRDLAAQDLYDFIAPATGMHAEEGSIDVFAEFNVRNGRISGGVKPVLKKIEVAAVDDGLWDRLKAWFVDKAVSLVSDDVPGREAVATVIPIKGSIDDPDVQLVPAVIGVLRNAFVEALIGGFAHLPPDVAEEDKGILRQAKEGLLGDAPPKAQPREEKDQDDSRRGGEDQ